LLLTLPSMTSWTTCWVIWALAPTDRVELKREAPERGFLNHGDSS